MKFRLWLESQNQELRTKLREAFKQARTSLIGGTSDYHTALGQLNAHGEGESQSTNRAGARAAEKLLGSVFENLKNLGQYDQNIASQAESARQWLNTIASGDIPANANHTVGYLLKLMFGDELYGEFSGQPVPSSDAKEPVSGGGLPGGDVSQGPDNRPVSISNSPMQPPNQQQIGQELSTNLTT